jgi:hypothetical protein
MTGEQVTGLLFINFHAISNGNVKSNCSALCNLQCKTINSGSFQNFSLSLIMEAKHIFLLILVQLVGQTVAYYELSVDRLEPLLGDEDQIVSIETLRIKRFNRTV